MNTYGTDFHAAKLQLIFRFAARILKKNLINQDKKGAPQKNEGRLAYILHQTDEIRLITIFMVPGYYSYMSCHRW